MNQQDHIPWHLDIDSFGTKYLMLYNAYNPGGDCGSDGMSIYYIKSTDGRSWNAEPVLILQVSDIGGWDNGTLYRPTFIVENNIVRIWYSARGTDGQWHIGYTESKLDDLPDN